MEKRLVTGELMVAIVVIIVVVLVLWYFWYVPVQNRTIVNVYKSSMRIVQTGMKMCDVSGGVLISGNSGEPFCKPNTAGNYPDINDKCGTAPYFYINSHSMVTTLNSSKEDIWDCKGCRLECTVDECEEIGECN